MLVSLAFGPEDKVIQYFTALMVEIPTTDIEVAEYLNWKNIVKQYQKNSTIFNKNFEPI